MRLRAFFYRTDSTRRSKFLTHALGHVETIFRSFSRFAYSIYLPNCIFFLKALGISAYVNTICKLNKSITRLCLENIKIVFYDIPICTKMIIAHFCFSFIYFSLSSQRASKAKKNTQAFLSLWNVSNCCCGEQRGEKKTPKRQKKPQYIPFLCYL